MASLFSHVNFSKLNESNYNTWSVKMRSYLVKDKLWNIVSDPPAVLTAAEQEADESAKASIILSVEDSQITYVKEAGSAKECWDKLRSLYVKTSASSIMLLTRQLYNHKLTPNATLQSHIAEFREIYDRLEMAGVSIDKLQKAYILLSSLDSKFDQVILSLQHLEPEVLSFDYVANKLLDCEKQNLFKQPKHTSVVKAAEPVLESVGEKALVTSHRRAYCHYCRKLGHIAKNCPSKLKNKEGKKNLDKHKVNDNLLMIATEREHNVWLIDSAATQHIVNNKALLTDNKSVSLKHICMADGSALSVSSIGSVYVPSLQARITNVYCVPKVSHCLLSVSRLLDDGYTVIFQDSACLVKKNGVVCARGILTNNLFEMQDKSDNVSCLTNKPMHDNCVHKLHRVLGHIGFPMITQLGKVCDLKVNSCKAYLDCAICSRVKLKSYPVPKFSQRKSVRPFQLVHIDLAGPFPPSKGLSKYIMLIVDDFSRYSYCILLKSKDEAFTKFRDWVEMIERNFLHVHYKVASLQSDRGGEFCSRQFQTWLDRKGIRHRKTNPYTPQENGVAERRVGVLKTMRDCMLEDAGLPFQFWGEAVSTATYVINRLWSSSVKQTPYFLLYGRQPALAHMRIFGSFADVLIPAAKRSKNQPKWQKLRFLGYQENTKGYRFITNNGQIVISRSANFEKHPRWEKIHSNTEVFIQNLPRTVSIQQPKVIPQMVTPSKSPRVIKTEQSSPATEYRQEGGASPVSAEPTVRRSQRANFGVPPKRLGFPDQVSLCVNNEEPLSYSEMLQTRDVKSWKAAMESEYKALKKQNVFSEVSLPAGQTVIGSKWVYKRKQLPNGSTKYKARLVAQGFVQNYLHNYHEVYAPTARSESMRLMLTIATKRAFKIRHYDFECAYLNATLEETIYLKPPDGYKPKDRSKVWLLKRALYGLKQSANRWNDCLSNKLKQLKFSQSTADACVFSRGSGEDQVLILLYVDDLCVAAKTDVLIQEVYEQLSQTFVLKDLGYLSHYLGIDIKKTPSGLLLTQSKKVEQILVTTRLTDAKIAKTPMVTDYLKQSESKPFANSTLFRSVVGSLLHIANWTRPDIAYAVSALSRRVAAPMVSDWESVKRVIRYLKGTQEIGLLINPLDSNELLAYCDSSFADAIDRKSCTGFLIKFAGVTIGWRSRKQSSVSLSTSEAEYCALSETCSELLWVSQFLKDLNEPFTVPVSIMEDSQTCIKLTETANLKSRTKYIGVKYQNVREHVLSGKIKLRYIESENNIADILTKPLVESKSTKLREQLGVGYT